MKTQFNQYSGTKLKMFGDGSSLITRPNQLQEQVTPGALLRNDPKRRKLPATWDYTIYHREAFNTDENPEVPFLTQTRTSPPNPWLRCFGNTGVHIPDPTLSGLNADWDRNSVRNLALNRLNEKVRGGLDLSVSAFEAGQTKRMLKATGNLLRFARGKMPKGGYKGPGSTKDIANGWLQFKYGWNPLLSDIFAVADESIRMHMNYLQKFTASGKLPFKLTSKNERGIEGFPFEAIRTSEGKATYRFTIWMQMPQNAFEVARFTSLNPISIGWELIPYSFVVDWVYDIGSYLRNVETAFLYGLQFVRGYTSELFVCETIETISGKQYKSPFDGSVYKADGMKAWNRTIKFHRDVLSSYPFPWRPTFEANLSSDNLFTTATLLRQLLKDSPKTGNGSGASTSFRRR